MSGTKATGMTIGEVEKHTGIPKRELKYYIEQGLLRPTRKSESGYWLYGEEDIRRSQLIVLCRELEFSVPAIRAILDDPETRWPAELERQILRLTDQKEQVQARLLLAEQLRDNGVWEALQTYCDTRKEKEAGLAAK